MKTLSWTEILPVCDVGLAALSRRLYGRQMPWDVDHMVDVVLPLDIEAAGEPAPRPVLRWQPVEARTAMLHLRFQGPDRDTGFDVQWVDDLPAGWPDDLLHPAAPRALRDILMTALVEPVRQRLCERFGLPALTLVDAQTEVPAWSPTQALGWTLLSPGGTTLRGMIRAHSVAGWVLLAANLPAELPRAGTRDRQALNLSLHCRPVALQRSELRQLALGDVLLFDAGPGTPSRLAARLRLSGRWVPGVRGLYLGHGLQIIQTQARDDARWPDVVSLQRNSNMSSTASSAPAAPTVDALPVWVDVELARLPLSIEQLRGLSIGQVFEIDAGVNPSLVTLHCGGQRLGRAELVMVGERLGVRLVELAATPATAAVPHHAQVGAHGVAA